MGHPTSIRGDRAGLGDVMMDGSRYFASFPDETSGAARQGEEPNTARLLTPELLAALADLDRELRSFLGQTGDETSSETSTEITDDRHP